MSGRASDRAAKFFDSYRAAFERLDAQAIAAHFAYPAHVTSDAGAIELTPVPTIDEWRPQIERLVATYEAVGVGSAVIRQLTLTDLSPRVAQAVVHWAVLDGAGAELYDFHALYTLVEIDGELRVAAIAHDEIPRLREARERSSPGA